MRWMESTLAWKEIRLNVQWEKFISTHFQNNVFFACVFSCTRQNYRETEKFRFCWSFEDPNWSDSASCSPKSCLHSLGWERFRDRRTISMSLTECQPYFRGWFFGRTRMSGKTSGIPRLGTGVPLKTPRTSGIPTPAARSGIPVTRKVLGSAVAEGSTDLTETKEGKITSQSVDLSKKRTVMEPVSEHLERDAESAYRLGKPNKSEIIITKGKPTRLVPKGYSSEELALCNLYEEVASVGDALEERRRDSGEELRTFRNPAENQGACGEDNCDSRDRTSKTIRECVMKDRTSKSSFILHLPAEDQETLEKTLKVRRQAISRCTSHLTVSEGNVVCDARSCTSYSLWLMFIPKRVQLLTQARCVQTLSCLVSNLWHTSSIGMFSTEKCNGGVCQPDSILPWNCGGFLPVSKTTRNAMFSVIASARVCNVRLCVSDETKSTYDSGLHALMNDNCFFMAQYSVHL